MLDARRATIRFQAPQLPPLADVAAYFSRSEQERWYTNGGPCSVQLVHRLTQRLHRPVVVVGNATLGLMVAARALVGQGAGRYAVLPSFTFAATVQAIQWVGLEPLFVDVDPDGWHPDPAQVRLACERHRDDIALVVGCSTFGTAPPEAVTAAWRDIADEHGVPLLVDSAAGFGSERELGQALGQQGDAEVFSFHATKPFAIGEGGAVSCRTPELAQRVAMLVNFGFGPQRTVEQEGGLNAKLDELNSAVGLAQLDRYDAVLHARRSRAAVLQRGVALGGLNVQAGSARSAFQFVPVLAADRQRRDARLAAAHSAGVEFRAYFSPALHQQEMYARAARVGALPVTDDVAARSLSLPMANDLSDEALEQIVELAVG